MMTTSATQIGEHTRGIVGLRLLPFLFVLYIVNYVDRSNLAYAAVGMSRDLGFSDHVFGVARESSSSATWHYKFRARYS